MAGEITDPFKKQFSTNKLFPGQPGKPPTATPSGIANIILIPRFGFGRILHDDAGAKVYFDPFRGTMWRETTTGF
jgi:hypothetical protein